MTRRALTFAEREGIKAFPEQLKLKEVSREARSRVWKVIYESIGAHSSFDRVERRSYVEAWDDIYYDAWVDLDHKFIDDCSDQPYQIAEYFKKKMDADYAFFFEILEFIVQNSKCPENIPEEINLALVESGCAYRLIAKSIVPISNHEMGESFAKSFETIASKNNPSEQHLKNSAKYLSQGRFSDSVRESIHAVESVARKIAPDAKTLSPALNAIDKKFGLHPALKEGFSKLYGYTNDQEGIRHSLINVIDAKVSETDALYMLGSCASFAAYLGDNIEILTSESVRRANL